MLHPPGCPPWLSDIGPSPPWAAEVWRSYITPRDTTLLGVVHERQHVNLGAVHQGGEFGHARAEPVGHGAPLLAGGICVGLSKGGADPSGNEATVSLERYSSGYSCRFERCTLLGKI